MIVKLTLDPLAGASLDNFNLFSNTDSYTTQFNISPIGRQQLLDGYTTNLVPDGTTTVRITPTGACGNSYDSSIINYAT